VAPLLSVPSSRRWARGYVTWRRPVDRGRGPGPAARSGCGGPVRLLDSPDASTRRGGPGGDTAGARGDAGAADRSPARAGGGRGASTLALRGPRRPSRRRSPPGGSLGPRPRRARADESGALRGEISAALRRATAPSAAPLTGVEVSGCRARELERRPAAVVKIPNNAEARPHTGIEDADVVYEQETEGGTTRFAAVFHSRIPDVVGNVRSARFVDVALVKPYGAVFVYAGAAARCWTASRPPTSSPSAPAAPGTSPTPASTGAPPPLHAAGRGDRRASGGRAGAALAVAVRGRAPAGRPSGGGRPAHRHVSYRGDRVGVRRGRRGVPALPERPAAPGHGCGRIGAANVVLLDVEVRSGTRTGPRSTTSTARGGAAAARRRRLRDRVGEGRGRGSRSSSSTATTVPRCVPGPPG
jgi:hypothetical protein